MFHFKNFSLYHENSALKIGTDAVLLASAIPLHHAHQILDIGCGCGVISFCLSWRMQNGQKPLNYTGIDIDDASIEEAKNNLDFFPLKNNIEFNFSKISIQDFSNHCKEKFDLIVSNPPFFDQSIKPDSFKKNISKHNDSLPFSDLINAVMNLLSPHGVFYLILPEKENHIFDNLTENQLYKFLQLSIKPTPDKPVNRIISGFSLQKCEPFIQNELCIRNAQNEYTQEYKNLTGDFYLNL